MTKLDRSRPYGEVYGHRHARFEQDHRLFDAAGNAIGEPDEPAAQAPREADPAPAAKPVKPAQSGAKRGRKPSAAKAAAAAPAPAPAPAATADDPVDAQLDAQLAS